MRDLGVGAQVDREWPEPDPRHRRQLCGALLQPEPVAPELEHVAHQRQPGQGREVRQGRRGGGDVLHGRKMRAFARIRNSRYSAPRNAPLMPRKVRTTPRKKPSQERSRATVAAILDATARLLVKHGFDRTTTNMVADTA